ncbi:ABC transporter ATP-binding protein [Alteromonas gilva]|uniref:ATP-binding cassette domain-containing protein n=1 Tax=Alteromonas gilva TaxID=2987522 RepID=A0ABT5L747_9ALTE|nr:ATP-binding cassette domain-containing protein [Alteromonas gilva]MDC8832894.1 ATP-binding cassette domain-containing protein [Alteromonas gilva]
MLDVIGVGKTFKNSKNSRKNDCRIDGDNFHALRDISFSCSSREIVGILGANGAGKTTLLRILCSVLSKSKGIIKLNGNAIDSTSQMKKNFGLLSGTKGLYANMTAREILEFYGTLYEIDEDSFNCRITKISEKLSIQNFLDVQIKRFSQGMKQRVAFARALIHDPNILILDEPTTGMDVPSARNVINFINNCQEDGKLVLVSTHNMSEVEKLCTKVVLLHDGLVKFQGTTEQMKATGKSDQLDDAFTNLCM